MALYWTGNKSPCEPMAYSPTTTLQYILGPTGSEANMATEIWVNIGSGNGLLPDGTKPLPEPMLTYHQ